MSSRVSFDEKLVLDNEGSGQSTPKLAAPIDIPQSVDPTGDRKERRRRKARRRSTSETSSISSQSGDSPTTPPESRSSSEAGASPVEVATSPILSYFLAQASPTRSGVNFSFKNRRKTVSGVPPLFEDPEDDSPPELPHVLHHARRLSSSWHTTGTIGVQQKLPPTGIQQERNTSLMRRLSLGGGTARPTFPSNPIQAVPELPIPNKVITPEHRPSTPRRAATISTASPKSHKHRPPSPMGERMLKGHFDGF